MVAGIHLHHMELSKPANCAGAVASVQVTRKWVAPLVVLRLDVKVDRGADVLLQFRVNASCSASVNLYRCAVPVEGSSRWPLSQMHRGK